MVSMWLSRFAQAIPVPARVGIVLALLALSSVASFLYINRPKPPVLTNQDMILLTEFENHTGEPLFNGTLRWGLALQLQQSPFLAVLSDARLQETLRSLKRAPDTTVTREIGREIAQRQGLKAFITGSLAKPERYYLITLEALDSQTGARLVQVQTDAESRDAVLHALSQAATDLRHKLGENLITVRRYATPLEVALNSLEALKAYMLAYQAQTRGTYREAVPLYQRTLELDPNSAIAYRGLAEVYDATQQATLATEAATQAYGLRERMGELENFRLTFLYHSLVTGKLEKCVEVLQQQKQIYPRDLSVYSNLASTYRKLGQLELAAETTAEALRRNPNPAAGH